MRAAGRGAHPRLGADPGIAQVVGYPAEGLPLPGALLGWLLQLLDDDGYHGGGDRDLDGASQEAHSTIIRQLGKLCRSILAGGERLVALRDWPMVPFVLDTTTNGPTRDVALPQPFLGGRREDDR